MALPTNLWAGAGRIILIRTFTDANHSVRYTTSATKTAMKKFFLILLAILVLSPVQVVAQAGQDAPLRIFLRGGPKTHGPADNGLHDHPGFVREWKPLLESRGARVMAENRFPTAAELENTDVLVMFAANAGTIIGEDRANLESFLRRGGGIMAIHDAVVTGTEPHWFKTIVGGSWENGVARYFEGENTYFYTNPEHPINKGASNFTITDEVYWELHMMPTAQILMASMQPNRPERNAPAPPPEPGIGNLIPQMWIYENQLPGGQPYRALVNLLGHHYSTFSSPHNRAILLRGIAWVGNRDPDSLTTPEEIAALE
jgi:type 1 glutamine amidotransferase